jgi:thiol peroxidase
MLLGGATAVAVAAACYTAAILGGGVASAAPEGAGNAAPSDVAEQTQVEETGFMYKELTVARDSARTGDGQQVSVRGKPVTLKGREIKVGDRLPDATLVGDGLETVSLGEGTGRVRIVSVVPALGTPTCEQQTHYLSEKSGGLDRELELITVSLDQPALQQKFAADAKIENVTFLSDASASEFGNAAGLLIEQPRILARAVLVVDAENVVRYLQVVPEITSMPDMDAAFAFARTLIAKSS